MSQHQITNAGLAYRDEVFAGAETTNITKFVFANVPGLQETDPVSPVSTIPTANVVHEQAVQRVSALDGNAIVMSATLDYTVGDFDYNWYGVVAEKADGKEVLIAVVHTSLTSKRKNNGIAQTGDFEVKSVIWRSSAIAATLNVTLATLPWQMHDDTFVTKDEFDAHSHAYEPLGIVQQLLNGQLPFKAFNLNGNHFFNENDGTGNYSHRIGHKAIWVQDGQGGGEFKYEITDSGQQYWIVCDNEAQNGYYRFLTAESYENDGAKGDYVTSWKEVYRCNNQIFQFFGRLLIKDDGTFLLNNTPVQNKRMILNAHDWFSSERKATHTEYIGIHTDQAWRNYPIQEDTHQIGDKVDFVWTNAGPGRIRGHLTNGDFYLAGQNIGKVIDLSAKAMKATATKTSETRWELEVSLIGRQ